MGSKTDDFLKSIVGQGVSDIHFKVSRPPLLRINGVLKPCNTPALGVQDTEYLAAELLGEQRWKKFAGCSEYDTSYAIPGFSRFRVNVFRQRGSVSLVLRVIPFNIPSLDELGVPPVMKQLSMSPRGLILVTGATGTGKSSTLAAMISHINDRRECHVITIEDPIEFLHRDKKASVNQREIGVDTDNFNNAFRAALRQDPDIILVGELRDQESMTIALRASETGHLVMSTMHTTDAKETIGRFIDAFPPHQHRQIRVQLASNLRAVASQRLLKRADGRGLVLAAEVMVVNAAIKEYIVDETKFGEILKNIENGRDTYGMQSFDQVMIDLVQKGLITPEEAIKNATSPNDLRLKMNFSETSGKIETVEM